MSINNALQSQKKVVLFFNRKGVAKRLQCGSCGHIPLCGTCGNLPSVRLDDLVCDRCSTEMWIPKACPACGKEKIALRGIGGAKIAAILKERFPEALVGRIEKGAIENPDANILIVTEYFFSSFISPFSEKRYGLVADLAADVHLYGSNFRGGELAARKVMRTRLFAKREGAECIIQTWVPDAIQPMLDIMKFMENELQLRKEYHLPPFRARVTLENASMNDLSEELRLLFVPHGEILELKPNNQRPTTNDLPDKIKLIYDGPYVDHDRAPQSQ